MAKPSEWASKLPGHYKKWLPNEWFAFRLGLIDAMGTPINPGLNRAVEFVMQEVIDLQRDAVGNGTAYAAQFRREKTDPKDERHAPVWRWHPPLRPSWQKAPQHVVAGDGQTEHKGRLHGSTLCQRHILGHWWRGELTATLEDESGGRLGSPYTDDSLEMAMWEVHVDRAFKSGQVGPATMDLLLGPGNRRVPSTATPLWLRLPPADWWWWIARSWDGCRAVLVDVDCKEAVDQQHFEARMRVLTCPGMPKPHLIVASKSGGRHMWYFVQRRVGVAKNGTVEHARRYSAVFEERLSQLGLCVESGVIEVFPSDISADTKFPAFPFGDRGFLCDASGLHVTHRHPMAAIQAWYDAMGRPTALHRYTEEDFAAATVKGAKDSDLALIKNPSPSRIKDRERKKELNQQGEKRPASGVVPLLRSRARVRKRAIAVAKRDPATRHGTSVEEAMEILERGAETGSTNRETKIVASLLRYHVPRGQPRLLDDEPDEEDMRRFRAWISSVAQRRSPAEQRHMEKRFVARFKKEPPLGAFDSAVSLCREDVLWAVDAILLRFPEFKSLRDRSGMLIVMLYVLGIARTNHKDEDGWVQTPVPTKPLQAQWRDGYKPYLTALSAQKLIRLDVEAVAPIHTSAHGRAAEYVIKLPKASTPAVRIQNPADIAVLLERHLDDAALKDLFPKRRGRMWKTAFWKKGRVGMIA
jgi:hypothetical protein